jgi:hypothetical protein
MRLRYATLFAAVLSLGWLAPQPGRPDLGLSAKADPDFYTRKRVNGEWITGWFPRAKSAPKAAAAKPVIVATAKPVMVAATGSVAVPVAPTMVAFPYVPPESSRREEMRSGMEDLARRIALTFQEP